ncbi:hypothetical protein SHD_2254 [Shewanella decolorationis S12]|jgi:hypothetical protein|uniref:Uncharacterized protein n=1 Tax=Shewanella decolorationis S12 TaxID=1353536 RepID=A0ABP2Z6R6_9GAMM|nr:hypothetical protein SHD_2254 [Shewanella decolorationis S12]GLR30543.1 hypothetical protein GCM10007922_00990 [Shewanella decolorationis]
MILQEFPKYTPCSVKPKWGKYNVNALWDGKLAGFYDNAVTPFSGAKLTNINK